MDTMETKIDTQETMDDYKDEIEASFMRPVEGDILTGTVISVSDDEIILDLKAFAEGRIRKEDFSHDPDCILKEAARVGDEMGAVVLMADDGEGHVLLSRKEASLMETWDQLEAYLKEKTPLTVKITGAVKGGVVVQVLGIRGFIPASKLALTYVEDPEEWIGKEIQAQVITADREENRLVLSAKELLYAEQMKEKQKKIASCTVGAVSEGVVESLQNYGAFILLDNGATGLLHISQISEKRIKHPSAVLTAGQRVTVKIIAVKDGKLSLSIKALKDVTEPEAESEHEEYIEEGQAATSLGALLSGIHLD